jgi:hypothetical protein
MVISGHNFSDLTGHKQKDQLLASSNPPRHTSDIYTMASFIRSTMGTRRNKNNKNRQHQTLTHDMCRILFKESMTDDKLLDFPLQKLALAWSPLKSTVFAAVSRPATSLPATASPATSVLCNAVRHMSYKLKTNSAAKKR